MADGQAGSGKAPPDAEDGRTWSGACPLQAVGAPRCQRSSGDIRAGRQVLTGEASAIQSPAGCARPRAFTRKTRPPSGGTSHCCRGCGLL